MIMTGDRLPLSRFGGDGSLDVFVLKGALESAFTRIGATGWSIRSEAHPALHPGRSGRIMLEEVPIGWIGELRPDIAGALDLGTARVAVAEIELDKVIASIPEPNRARFSASCPWSRTSRSSSKNPCRRLMSKRRCADRAVRSPRVSSSSMSSKASKSAQATRASRTASPSRRQIDR
ncbi:MAG: hypothetical protein R2843_03745 [Thermomicrobiales bacterium]